MKELNRALVTLLAGAALVAPGLLSVMGNMPTLLHPGSVVLVLPMFSGVPLLLTLLIAPVAFWLWLPALFRGSGLVPIRSLILLTVAAGVSSWWFAVGWKYGVQYEGLVFAQATLLIDIVAVLAIGFILVWGRRRTSFWLNLAGHWLLMAWLATYAFPYLGETP